MRRAGALAAFAVALCWAPPAVALPTIERDATLPEYMRLDLSAAAGQERFASITSEDGALRFSIETEPEPGVPWTIGATDCTLAAFTNEVVCIGPVANLIVLGGEGDEGFEARTVEIPIFTGMGAGEDSVRTGEAADWIGMGPGNDRVHSGRLADRVHGEAGNDALFGGPGHDELDAGPGADRIFGEGAPEYIDARDGEIDRRIDCGRGDDRLERARVDGADPPPWSC